MSIVHTLTRSAKDAVDNLPPRPHGINTSQSLVAWGFYGFSPVHTPYYSYYS